MWRRTWQCSGVSVQPCRAAAARYLSKMSRLRSSDRYATPVGTRRRAAVRGPVAVGRKHDRGMRLLERPRPDRDVVVAPVLAVPGERLVVVQALTTRSMLRRAARGPPERTRWPDTPGVPRGRTRDDPATRHAVEHGDLLGQRTGWPWRAGRLPRIPILMCFVRWVSAAATRLGEGTARRAWRGARSCRWRRSRLLVQGHLRPGARRTPACPVGVESAFGSG